MDPLLVAVTVVALVLATAMAVVLSRILREERLRSEARIAALTEMSAERVAPPASVAPTAPRSPQRSFSAGDVEISRPLVPPAPSMPTLFAEPERTSPWGRRFAVIGVLAVVLALGVAAAMTRGRAQHTAAGPAQAAAAPAAATQSAPLELLSLRYQQERDRMTITGLVENPRGGAPLSHVTATAFLFGADGTFLTSGRAPLDYTTLAPGDESPFVISVPVTGVIARYRVGFRGEDGRVIAHVDRRAVGTLAERGSR